MANRHDVIIWDADVYGAPKNFVEGLEMAFTLSEQAISSPVSHKLLAFAADIEVYSNQFCPTKNFTSLKISQGRY